MSLMQKIREIVNQRSEVKSINSAQLHNSGTGYIYPSLCDEPVTRFVDEYGRQGYLFQLITTNKSDGSKKRSCFLVHCRYTDSDNCVVYSGLDELYYDCIIREYDQEKFLNRLEMLLKNESIGNWRESRDEGTKDLEFQIGVLDLDDVEQRPFLAVVDPLV
jgi:hypothetical protein